MPRSRGRYLPLPRFHINHTRNLKILYGLRVCRDLMSKFALFFLPIFLYQVGSQTAIFEFLAVSNLQRGMLAIGVYYIISASLSALFSIWAGKLAVKIGYQKTFVFSYLLYLVQFILLFYLSSAPNLRLYLLVAVVNGLQTPVFWASYLTILSKNTKRASMGQDMGVLQLLLQVVGVVAPAVSGLIAYLIGMEVLFLLGMVMTLISVSLVLLMDEKESRFQVSWQEFFAWLQERQYGRLAASMMGKYIYDAAVFLWPLYVFLLLGTIDKVGYLYTISLFLAMLVTFFTGVYIDRTRNKKPFYLSGGLLSVIWLLRTQVFTVWGIILSDTFDRLAANVHALFFDTAVIKRGKGSRAFSYFIYREVIVNTAAVFFWLAFVIFFLLNGGWTGIFVFASVGVMFSLLVRENKELEPPI